ncbi:Ig-like domain-containing protein [Cohnella suwonensis]|uniref:Ig-like domain-containing protein n=1 Tax=Cohnella suwonensis TaxID=696072 RepID=A0ABW0LUY6_9BACL
MRLQRTLSITLLMALVLQLWVAGAAVAAPSGPVAVSTYPADNQANVPANAKLRIKFDENVSRGGGTIAIKNASTNASVALYNVASDSVNITFISSDTVEINPGSTLVAGQNYYIEISSNAFLNGAGAGYAGISNSTTWNFGVIASDGASPSVETYTPVSGGTIAATGVLKLKFNEIVTTASGSIRITRVDTGDTQVVSVLSTEVTGSGIDAGGGKTEISVQPNTRLVSGKNYQVQIDAGAFADIVGNPTTAISWSFSTAPSVINVSATAPADNASNVPSTGLQTSISFGATTIYKGTTGKIYLKRVSDNYPVDTIDMALTPGRVTVSGASATFDFAGNVLEKNKSYYIMIDPGVLKDGTNNPYEGIIDTTTWNFATVVDADNVPPAATAFTPVATSTTSAISGNLSIAFNEPVKPGSGTILIRNITSNTIFCSIPVTSGAVTGGGTNTITISPSSVCGNFVKNTTYSVQIGSQAITDMSNNAYGGISNDSVWWFRISSDSTVPELLSTSPVPGSNSVKRDAVLSMTFDEPIAPISMSDGVLATIYPVIAGAKGSGISAVLWTETDPRKVFLGPVSVTPDPVDPSSVILTPIDFSTATTYIVNVPNDAVTDVAGNPFPGILNDYRWTFQTLGSDTAAPILSSAAMDGSAIVLTYNEDLDESILPYPSNFYVTVNEVPRQVNGVAISGKTVRLSLQSGVAVGQTVKVAYTRDSSISRMVQDLSANPAPSFAAREVTNTLDTTLAKPLSGILNGTTLTLTFNKTLEALASGASSQFVVKFNGTAQSVSAASASGTTLTLTLPYAGTNVQSVSVSYVPGSYPLRDLSGNAVTGFADFFVQNANDITPPVLASAAAAGTKVTLTFNEGLDLTAIPLKSSFSIYKGGTAAVISSVAVTNNAVELTLASQLETDAVLYVSYIPSSQGIKDLAGNAAASINSYRIVAGNAVAATLSSAVAKSSIITLAYSAGLNTTSQPYVSQYNVKVDGAFASIGSLSVSGQEVKLTLAAPIKKGQTVSLSYMSTGIPLKDMTNQPVPAIAEMAVTNQSSDLDNVPEYLEANTSGGLQFVNAKASSTGSGTSPTGKSLVRYTLDGPKFLAAYDVFRQGTAQTPVLTFKVPSTELGALVAVPLTAIMDASSRISNASFRVEYGELQFELPLTAINYSKENYMAGGNIATSYLQLSIEKNASSPIVSAINVAGAQMLATPADFSAGILSGSNLRTIDSFDQYVKRSFVVSSLSNSSNVAVVRLDSEANELNYVPTTTEPGTNGVKVNFFRKGSSTYAVVRKSATFTDMISHWASNDVLSLASKFVVSGDTAKTFSPGKSITRGDFAEFLARGIGLTGDRNASTRYSDVTSANANAAYIGAVSKAGIVEGGSDGKFRPNATITREEIATMLVRAMNYVGVQSNPSTSTLSQFKDKSKISKWALDGMAININAGIIKGATPTTVNPQSNATRAEAAIMIKRFLEYVDFL